jgi:hypothetical protein
MQATAAGRQLAGQLDFGRLLIITCIATLFVGVFVPLAQVVFPAAGNDPSFF